MKIVGVTGLIGSGKSTVCKMMIDFGAKYINADEIGHNIYLPNTPGYDAVIAAFGDSIIDFRNDLINRKKLSNIVFEDYDKLKILNKITHPLIEEQIKEKLSQYKSEGADVVALEAALLIDAKYEKIVDRVWLTTAPIDLIVERLRKSRGMTRADVMRRINAQLPIGELREHADDVISTANPINVVFERVKYLYEHI